MHELPLSSKVMPVFCPVTCKDGKCPNQDGYVSYSWERRMQEMLSVPNSINFLCILFLPKDSDRVASGYNDLEDTLARANTWLNAANASLYGFEDYHGIDIGGVLAVRSPMGFIFISSVINQENVPATLSGLSNLYKLAMDTSCRMLVVSRVSNQKVLPWMVSSTGAIRCYDTVSLSHSLTRLPLGPGFGFFK
ncbi:hypothetical protein VNO78_14305 [Psophocarpus tetragonolobus]|uniref:Uncharacterized protein n=1 Tax=Psophocarpus tetragonolobus TaxID=3891 RepID=A0AAN9XQF5_PSOTE